jgi:hypothetical protein
MTISMPLTSVAVLGLSVVATDAYTVGVLRFWRHSIDLDCILLHVKFEGVLSISVLEKRGRSKPITPEKFIKF